MMYPHLSLSSDNKRSVCCVITPCTTSFQKIHIVLEGGRSVGGHIDTSERARLYTYHNRISAWLYKINTNDGCLFLPFRDTDVLKSPSSEWDWWRDRGRGHSRWLRWSSKALSTTYPSAIEEGTVRNRCKACETWLWKVPKSTAPTKMIPVVIILKEN
jgi:hypothetical protein